MQFLFFLFLIVLTVHAYSNFGIVLNITIQIRYFMNQIINFSVTLLFFTQFVILRTQHFVLFRTIKFIIRKFNHNFFYSTAYKGLTVRELVLLWCERPPGMERISNPLERVLMQNIRIISPRLLSTCVSSFFCIVNSVVRMRTSVQRIFQVSCNDMLLLMRRIVIFPPPHNSPSYFLITSPPSRK